MATTAVSEGGGEGPEAPAPKGGRSLRKRETAACPLCFNTFFSGELEAHVSACLYFLEEAGERKKHKKAKTTPPKPSAIKISGDGSVFNTATQKLSTPNPKSNISITNSKTNSVNGEAQQSNGSSPKRSTTTEKWSSTSVAQWNIQEAPVYRPTTEEFQHPLRYIASIRPEAEKYGICRIIPPYPHETWSKNIEPSSFIFKTKVQNIHQLKTRWQGPNEVFVSGLCAFHDKRGTPLKTVPKVDGRDLDLFKLFLTVIKNGGMQEVNRKDLWKHVADELRVSDSNHRALNVLRQHYYKVLYPYELYRKNKMHHQNTTNNNIVVGTANLGLSVAEDIQAECFNTDVPPGLSDSVEVDTDNEFGFYEGKYFILQKFERMAHTFQRKWFPDVKKPDSNVVESEFWRIVETAEENVQVHYGSDLDVTKHSSGFPRDPPPPSSAISPPLSHWNLNHLPRMEGSVLRHLNGQILGVTDPMMYIGMLFSSFCWHTEDNYLYSINYLHKGACKTWYGVPASAASQFENVMKEAVPELFMRHPDLLHLLITMISPSVLVKNKVPVVHTLQEPGQYVITFPQAYHAGFSHGFTCAEAVNFAPADWLPFGASSVDSYRTTLRSSVFSHDQLVSIRETRATLCTVAQKDFSPETAYWLHPELKKMRDNEQKSRDLLRMAGLTVQMVGTNSMLNDNDPSQCKFCRYDCYLSAVTCPCSPQSLVCLRHAEQTIQVRVPLNILDDLVSIVEKRVGQPPQLRRLTSPSVRINKSHSTVATKENFVNSSGSGRAEQKPERRSVKEALFSAERLYQNHIPPPPSIPSTPPITYTPVILTDLTTPIPTTTTHYIPKVAPRIEGGILAPAPAKPSAPVAVRSNLVSASTIIAPTSTTTTTPTSATITSTATATVTPPVTPPTPPTPTSPSPSSSVLPTFVPPTPITVVNNLPPLPRSPTPSTASSPPLQTPSSPPAASAILSPTLAQVSPMELEPSSPATPILSPQIGTGTAPVSPSTPPVTPPLTPTLPAPAPVPVPVPTTSVAAAPSSQVHIELKKKMQRQAGRNRVAPVNLPVPDAILRKSATTK